MKIEISNPDKMLFPADGITKADLAAYYDAVARVMLPHVKRRPLMLQRFPNGIAREGWVQQEISSHTPAWIARATVPKAKGTVTHVMANDTDTLQWLANQACITLHEWLSRSDKLSVPDLLLVDLDPSPQNTFADVKRGARATQTLLSELGLPAFLKTTGSKGLHIAVPLKRRQTFEDARAFAFGLADELGAREPDLLTPEFRKAKRNGRIFVDVTRNQYAQAAVAPYSVRALPGAPVSCPLDWDELSSKGLDAQTFTLKNVPARVEKDGDPWAAIGAKAVTLARAQTLLDRMTKERR